MEQTDTLPETAEITVTDERYGASTKKDFPVTVPQVTVRHTISCDGVRESALLIISKYQFMHNLEDYMHTVPTWAIFYSKTFFSTSTPSCRKTTSYPDFSSKEADAGFNDKFTVS